MAILVFAPHNDDEILGCGGTIKKYINEGCDVYVCEVTSGPKYKELQAEAKEAHRYLGVKETYFLNLPVCNLRNIEQSKINAAILDIVDKVRPEIVFVPHIGDMHTDHREVTLAAMVALRPVSAPYVKMICAYETLSETGWNVPSVDNEFIPNIFIDIEKTIGDKIEAMKYYQSQINEYPHPRSCKALVALSEYRGTTMCMKNAEAFMLIRGII